MTHWIMPTCPKSTCWTHGYVGSWVIRATHAGHVASVECMSHMCLAFKATCPNISDTWDINFKKGMHMSQHVLEKSKAKTLVYIHTNLHLIYREREEWLRGRTKMWDVFLNDMAMR